MTRQTTVRQVVSSAGNRRGVGTKFLENGKGAGILELVIQLRGRVQGIAGHTDRAGFQDAEED